MWGFVRGYHGLFLELLGGNGLQISSFTEISGWLWCQSRESSGSVGFSFSFTPTVRIIGLTRSQIEDKPAECCASVLSLQLCSFSYKHISSRRGTLKWERNWCPHLLGLETPPKNTKANHTAGPVPEAQSSGSQSGAQWGRGQGDKGLCLDCAFLIAFRQIWKLVTFAFSFQNSSKQKQEIPKSQCSVIPWVFQHQ